MTIDIALSDAPGRAWQRAVDASTGARLAHAPQWQDVIAKVYGHTPVYLEAEAGDGSVGVLPAFVVSAQVDAAECSCGSGAAARRAAAV